MLRELLQAKVTAHKDHWCRHVNIFEVKQLADDVIILKLIVMSSKMFTWWHQWSLCKSADSCAKTSRDCSFKFRPANIKIFQTTVRTISQTFLNRKLLQTHLKTIVLHAKNHLDKYSMIHFWCFQESLQIFRNRWSFNYALQKIINLGKFLRRFRRKKPWPNFMSVKRYW